MSHSPVVVSPSAHARPRAEFDSVASTLFNRRALRAGTAIATAFRKAIGLTPTQAFVAPPVDGRAAKAEPVAKSPPNLVGRIGRMMQPGPDRDPQFGKPPRLMPSDAGRYVNAMPAHAMAAGGRPMMMKIPGK